MIVLVARSFLLGSILLLPLGAFAHVTGVSFEDTVAPYTMDIGYSTPAPETGQTVLFDFRLRTADNPDVPFADVWVRIASETGVTVFGSGIGKSPFGGARMSYVFPGPGTYTISTRYEDTNKPLAETSFQMIVVPVLTARQWYKGPLPYVAAAGLLVLAGGAFLLWRKKRAIT